MKKHLLFIIILISLAVGCKENGRKLSLSPFDSSLKNWERDYWTNKGNYGDTTSNNFKDRVLILHSDSLSSIRWFKKVAIKPYAHYKISGYIKTKNVEGENEKSGAGFRLGKFKFSGDSTFAGTNKWTRVSMEFDSEGDDSFILECLLGKGGKAKGKVYFDNLKLEEISSKNLNPVISLDFADKKEKISPLMYGQFIEHMGRSIYGGIWAEMLTDRKFYYKPGTKRSAWKVNVDTASIRVDSSYDYSRGKLPVLFSNKDSLTLSQDSLSVIAGKGYDGRIVFKAQGDIKNVNIALVNGEQIEEKTFPIKGNGYIKVPFHFKASKNSKNAHLQLNFSGNGKITLAAVSLMPADNIEGFRADVLNLLKQLNSPVYRWPGGNFVSGYNWKDGVGNMDKRPTRFEHAWNGLEYNDVGIDEFMKLVNLLDTKAYIAVNTGLGNAKMASQEVEYVNGSKDSEMGEIRNANGHAEPYNVKLWAVGNEMFGDWQLGHMPIEEYVKKHNKVAKAMWSADPDIKLVAVGNPGKWNDMMYSNCSEYMNYISEHFYRQDWHAGGLLTHVRQIPDAIRDIANEHRRCRMEIPELKGKNIKIALDEWNYWYGPHVYGLLGTRYFLRDALGIAAGINEFSRQSDIFYMANYAQTVNVIGAIKTTKTDSWLEGTGLVLKLYRDEFGSQPIRITGSPEPLDIAATLKEGGKYLTLSVINATHQNYSLELKGVASELSSTGESFIITGKNDMVYNDEKNKHRIRIENNKLNIENGKLLIPKESAGIYKFEVKK